MSIIEINYQLKPMTFHPSYCDKKKREHLREDFMGNRGTPFCYWCGAELVIKGKEYCTKHKLRHGKRWQSCTPKYPPQEDRLL